MEPDLVLPVTTDGSYPSVVASPFGGYLTIFACTYRLGGISYRFSGQAGPTGSASPIEGCDRPAGPSSGPAPAVSSRISLLGRFTRILLCPVYLPLTWHCGYEPVRDSSPWVRSPAGVPSCHIGGAAGDTLTRVVRDDDADVCLHFDGQDG